MVLYMEILNTKKKKNGFVDIKDSIGRVVLLILNCFSRNFHEEIKS